MLLLLSAGAAGDDLSSSIAKLGTDEANSQLELIDRYGCRAVARLADHLSVVPSGHYAPARQAASLQRQVYTIAALRYITGQDFYAPISARQLRRYDRAGRDFLTDTAPRGRTKFFGIWMSRGSLYFAPAEAQARIIASWKAYARSGACHRSEWPGRTSSNFYMSGSRRNLQ